MNSPEAGTRRIDGYTRMAAESGVSGADPHQLINMLYDGALAAIHQARAHMQAKRIADKGAAIGKAIRIIDEGLKISLDRDAGGELATRLLELYDYLVMRLLQANLRSDEAALVEVAQRLSELRDAWAKIRPAVAQQAQGAIAAPAAAVAPAASAVADAGAAPRARNPFDQATPGAAPRLVVSA